MAARHRQSALPQPWTKVGDDYRPVEVETPAHVRAAIGDWADPEVVAPEQLAERVTFGNDGVLGFDPEGRPLNPSGPTGKRGRLLGKWGPNHAADPVILRRDPVTGALQMLAIERKDTGRWAIPGGMVDAGERMSATATRELKEETDVDVDMSDAVKVYEGVVKDDPRNTDNAWMETAVYAKLLDDDTGARITPSAGDDARQVQWMTLTDAAIGKLYANHGEFVLKALEALGERPVDA